MYEYPAKIIRVIDGDTFVVKLDLGFNLEKKVTIRLLGVDTHELDDANKDLGQIEKEFVEKWFKDNDTKQEFSFKVKTNHSDSFGRWLGSVSTRIDDEDLSGILFENFDDIVYE